MDIENRDPELETLIQYLQDELPADQLFVLEKRLETEPSLNEKFSQLKLLLAHIKQEIHEEQRIYLQDLEAGLNETDKPSGKGRSRFNQTWWWGLGLLGSVGIALLIWWMIQPSVCKAAALFATYGQPLLNDVVDPLSRGSNGPRQASAEVLEAFRLYDLAHMTADSSIYAQAEAFFQRSLKTGYAEQAALQFYLAMTQWGQRQYAIALQTLDELQQQPGQDFQAEALYYQALWQVKQCALPKAKVLLDQIEQQYPGMLPAAKELQNSLY